MTDPHPPPHVLELELPPPAVMDHLARCPVCRIDRRLLRDREVPSDIPGLTAARSHASAWGTDGIGRAIASGSDSCGDARLAGASDRGDLGQGEIFGDYQVERKIGRGGMASVYAVRHRDRGTRHALKVARTDLATGRRMIREGRLQGSVRHPNIVGVEEVIEDAGRLALVLELVPGTSLDQLMRRVRLSADVVDTLGGEILAGLAAAHAAGLVHRDVKPANVLLAAVSGGGVAVKLGDFGLAKGEAPDSVFTAPGAVVGTAAYMAPEQRLDPRSADARADVYAAGATLFEAFTGERWFVPGHTQTDEEAEGRLAGVPEPFRGALASALRPDPADRPGTGGALLERWRRRQGPAMAWPADLLGVVRDLGGSAPVDVFPGPGDRRRSVRPEGEPLVGRRTELTLLQDLVASGVRAVTLAGPPGAGKSRLAQRFAWRVLGEGVFCCDLTGADGGTGIASAIAGALRICLQGSDPVSSLAEALRGWGRSLWVLDNLEPSAGAARALGQLVCTVPDATFVTTSTRPTGVAGERVVHVGGLEDAEALELLRRLVGRLRPELDLGSDTERLRRLIALVDGLPAGIELIGARAAVLPLADLELRFRDGRAIGVGAAAEASWAFLDPGDRVLLRRISVFVGPFDAVDAEVVSGSPDAADRLAGLLRDHLVRGARSIGRPAFVMYRSVRDLAAQHLHDAGDEQETRLRHAEHLAAVGEAVLGAVSGPDGRARWEHLQERVGDLRSAVDHTLRIDRVDLAARLWCALHVVMDRIGPLDEVVQWGERLLDHPALPPSLDPKVRSRLTDAYKGRGDFARARVLLEAARPLTDTDRAVVEMQLGDVHAHDGQLDAARRLLERSVERLETAADPLLLGNALRVLATVVAEQRDLVASIALNVQALTAYEQARDQLRAAYVRVNLACDLGELGRIDESEKELLAALPVVEAHHDEKRRVSILRNLGQVALHRNDIRAALTWSERAVEIGRRNGFVTISAGAAVSVSHVLSLLGRFDDAAAVAADAAARLRGRGADGLLVQLLTNEVAALVQLGRWEEASRVLAEARAADEGSGRFSAYLKQEGGRIAMARGDAAAAREALRESLRVGATATLATARARLFAEIAGDLSDLGEDPEPALSALRAHDVDPRSIDGIVVDAVLTRILARSGRKDEAAAKIDRVQAWLLERGWPEGSLPAVHLRRARAVVGPRPGRGDAHGSRPVARG